MFETLFLLPLMLGHFLLPLANVWPPQKSQKDSKLAFHLETPDVGGAIWNPPSLWGIGVVTFLQSTSGCSRFSIRYSFAANSRVPVSKPIQGHCRQLVISFFADNG